MAAVISPSGIDTFQQLPPDLSHLTNVEEAKKTGLEEKETDSSLVQSSLLFPDLTYAQPLSRRQPIEGAERSTGLDEETTANPAVQEGGGIVGTSLQYSAGRYGVSATVSQTPAIRSGFSISPSISPMAIPIREEVPQKSPTIDKAAQKILQVHLARQILRELQRVEQNCGEPIAAMYVDSLFSGMRTMRDLLPTDPFVEVLMALYDAMAGNNNWMYYQAHQLKEASRILKSLLRKKNINNRAVEKAILSLEDIGFDTTPFRVEIDEDE